MHTYRLEEQGETYRAFGACGFTSAPTPAGTKRSTFGIFQPPPLKFFLSLYGTATNRFLSFPSPSSFEQLLTSVLSGGRSSGQVTLSRALSQLPLTTSFTYLRENHTSNTGFTFLLLVVDGAISLFSKYMGYRERRMPSSPQSCSNRGTDRPTNATRAKTRVRR